MENLPDGWRFVRIEVEKPLPDFANWRVTIWIKSPIGNLYRAAAYGTTADGAVDGARNVALTFAVESAQQVERPMFVAHGRQIVENTA